MIVSHKHKFIFIKTMKTASSSMEIALSDILGPDDIITPARTGIDERRNIGAGGQNYKLDHPDVPPIPLMRKFFRRPERYYHPTVGYYEHMPAWRIKRYLGDDIWNSYYKFAFERNPWDRQVSWYFYKTRSDKRETSFEGFFKFPHKAFVENYDLYSIDGRIAVDFVGQYENLTADFEKAMVAIGQGGKFKLPVTNVSKTRRPDYQSYYNENSKALVIDWYKREIEHFGYTY